MNKAHLWSDDEVGYCEGLVRSRGNGDVPRRAVASYLRVQMVQAQLDGSPEALDAFDALAALLNYWNSRKLGDL
jgi:hypothetical protein